jgi:hypothetical protein
LLGPDLVYDRLSRHFNLSVLAGPSGSQFQVAAAAKDSPKCRLKLLKTPLQSAARASKSDTLPNTMVTACKHPRVRIVSRHEDTEYVECLECGDVFDSEEFHDMEIEETAEKKAEEEDDE